MKRLWILVLLFSSLFILTGCGGSGGGSGDDSEDNLSSLASMNITDAKSVFISTSSGAQNSSSMKVAGKSSSNSSTNHLFKINNHDVIEEVSFFDKNHKPIALQLNGSKLVPVFLENINDDYIAVGFRYDFDANSAFFYLQTAILVRKSDGAIFKLSNIPNCGILNNYYGGYIKTGGLFKTDSAGNIYYISESRDEWSDDKHYHSYPGITKISVSGSNLTSTIITPSTDTEVNYFDVDDSGNIVYSAWVQLTSETVIRLRTSSGTYRNVPTYSTVWKEQDGKFHYIYEQDVKMINPNNFESEIYGSFAEYPSAWADYKVSLQGYTYLMSNGGILEVYNPGASPRTISLAGITFNYIYGVSATDNYYYIAGKDNSSNCFLIKVTPGGTSYSNILGNDYQVYAFAVSESDGITFNALRTSDMKKVFGKVSINGGAVTIIDSESDTQVTFLERIR